MNPKVILLREVIVKLTPMIAGRGLRVTQVGAKAFVQTDKTGKPIRVNIPSIADDADDVFLMAIQGFIDHEVAHILFTEFTIIPFKDKRAKAIAKEFRHDPKIVGPRLHHLHNIVEDPFIEKMMSKQFKGSAYNLEKLHEMFLARITLPTIKATTDPDQQFSAIMVPLTRAWCGQAIFQRFMDDNKLWDNPTVKDFVAAVPDAIKAKMPGLQTTRETLVIAEAFYEALFPPTPPPPPAPPKPEPKKSEEPPPPDAEKEKSTEKSPEKEDGEGDNTDKPEDDEDKGSKGKDEKPAEEEPDDEAEREKPTKPEKDDDADDEAEADETEGDEASDGAPDDDDDDAGGDKPDDEEGDDGDADGEDKPGEPDGSSPPDDDGESDEAEEGGKGGDGDVDDEPEDEESEGEPEDGDVGDGPPGGHGEVDDSDDPEEEADKEPASPFEDKEIDLSETDMAEAIAGLITEMATEEHMDSDYRVFSRELDKIEIVEDRPLAPGIVESLEDRVKHMVAPMQKDIERMMAARTQTLKVPGFRSGRLHGGSLHRLTSGDDRIFRRKQEHHSKATAVSLLIDCSGSMSSGNKIGIAMASAFALSMTLERVGIVHEVLGFTTLRYSPGKSAMLTEMRAEKVRMGRGFSRNEVLWMPIFKAFNERLTPTVKKRFAMPMTRDFCLDQNVDGECVRIAGTRLAQRREERKVLIAMSDGSPACDSDNMREIYGDLKRAVLDVKNMRVDLVGLGILDDSVAKYYPKFAVLKRLEQLPGAVMGELKRILLAA